MASRKADQHTAINEVINSRPELEQAAAFERRGEWISAEAAFGRAFHHACERGDLVGAVDALRGKCRVCQPQQRYEEAEELAELSFQVASLTGLAQAAARAVNSLAAVAYYQQRWSEARKSYVEARGLAFDHGDDELVGFTSQNLGIISNIIGDRHEAKTLYLESIGSTVRSGDRRTAMIAYGNLAMVCADLQEWMEAEVYCSRGTEIAEQLGDVTWLAKLRANRAEPLIHTSQLTQARKTLDTVEQLATQAADAGTLADVARFRAMIAREEGDLKAAAQHIAHSLRLATEAGLNLEHAEALEERACLLDAEGRIDEAFATLHEAHEGYQALGAQRDAARTREVLDRWSSQKSTVASTLPEMIP